MNIEGVELEDEAAKPGITKGWTVDRTINLPLLLAIAAIGASAVAFQARTNERLDNFEKVQTAIAAQMSDMAPRVASTNQKTVDLETEFNILLNSKALQK